MLALNSLVSWRWPWTPDLLPLPPESKGYRCAPPCIVQFLKLLIVSAFATYSDCCPLRESGPLIHAPLAIFPFIFTLFSIGKYYVFMLLDSPKPSISSKYMKNTFSGANFRVLKVNKFTVKAINKMSDNGLTTLEVQTVALNTEGH